MSKLVCQRKKGLDPSEQLLGLNLVIWYCLRQCFINTVISECKLNFHCDRKINTFTVGVIIGQYLAGYLTIESNAGVLIVGYL